MIAVMMDEILNNSNNFFESSELMKFICGLKMSRTQNVINIKASIIVM
jgi:hypothetical protein